MKFQPKMRTVYIILGILTAIVAGSIYYSISVEKLNEGEKQNIAISAKQLRLQYDEMIQSMKDVSYYLLSDADTLESITAISRMKRSEKTNQYFINAENIILSQENNDYISKKFYRVIFCNDNCSPIANNNPQKETFCGDIDYKKMPWYEKAKKNPDTFTIMGIHTDLWGKKENPEIFSVIKQIQGENRGYIEVQMKLEDMQDRLRIADTDVSICIINDEGEILYQNGDTDTVLYKNCKYGHDIPSDELIGNEGKKYLVAGEYSTEGKATVIVYKDKAMIQKSVSEVMYMSFALIACMLFFSFLYVSISTRHLTKPIIQLQKAIQNTNLETLEQSMNLDFSEENDEFRRIGKMYENMKSRLHKAVLREQQLSTLQLQTQFDMLQAQVNPHFIYNVLNVISSRGIINDDEIICDMCDDLAGMLRYSTDTKERYATLKEEIDYLKLYFSLLKFRYDYKLEYSIHMESEVEKQKIPKLVIQQLVENCITHGFKNSSKIMKISVEGYTNQGYWYIKVRDNGEGFAEDVLKELEEQMEKLKMDLSTNRRNVEMRIGGMGILNTFARLYLLNTENLIFRIQNQSEGGAEVIIGAALDYERK